MCYLTLYLHNSTSYARFLSMRQTNGAWVVDKLFRVVVLTYLFVLNKAE